MHYVMMCEQTSSELCYCQYTKLLGETTTTVIIYVDHSLGIIIIITPEVSLQPGVDSEAASSGVHAGHILHIMHLLQSLLSAIIPMRIVQVLPDQRMRLHCAIRVHFRHVHVIDEVNQILGSRRAKVPSSLLLQRFLHDLLQH